MMKIQLLGVQEQLVISDIVEVPQSRPKDCEYDLSNAIISTEEEGEVPCIIHLR